MCSFLITYPQSTSDLTLTHPLVRFRLCFVNVLREGLVESMDREKKVLITELTQGKDLAKQLSNHLNPSSSSSSSSPETREYLIQKILSSYEKALSMLKYDASSLKSCKLDFINIVESPCSFPNTSPRSEVSDQDCKDVYKKR